MPKTKGLGKGLGSLLGVEADIDVVKREKKEQEKPANVEKAEELVKIRMIEPNRKQPRKNFDEEGLAELAESIKQFGVIQPLIVQKKGERYQIVAGERRWRAAKLAGLKEVPVIIKEYTDQEIAEISLIENIQRQDLNPIEEAMAYQRLLTEFSMKQEELAERVSKSRTLITNSIRLLKLPEMVCGMLAAGELSTGHGKVILGLPTKELQEQVAQKAVEEKLSVRETELLIKKLQSEKAPKEKKALANQIAYDDLESKLKSSMGTKVKISRKTENSGKIEIDFYSLEDLERIRKIMKV